jgi:hypothetical protein
MHLDNRVASCHECTITSVERNDMTDHRLRVYRRLMSMMLLGGSNYAAAVGWKAATSGSLITVSSVVSTFVSSSSSSSDLSSSATSSELVLSWLRLLSLLIGVVLVGEMDRPLGFPCPLVGDDAWGMLKQPLLNTRVAITIR